MRSPAGPAPTIPTCVRVVTLIILLCGFCRSSFLYLACAGFPALPGWAGAACLSTGKQQTAEVVRISIAWQKTPWSCSKHASVEHFFCKCTSITLAQVCAILPIWPSFQSYPNKYTSHLLLRTPGKRQIAYLHPSRGKTLTVGAMPWLAQSRATANPHRRGDALARPRTSPSPASLSIRYT